MGWIYKITGPTGKSYVGKTIQKLEVRMKQHADQSNSATATKVWHFGRTLVNSASVTTEENLIAYNKSEHVLVKN
jgi:hypothetical protein